MENNRKVLATLIAVWLIATSILNTTSASFDDETKWSWDKANYIDINNNGIADGKEDFDNDWILNKDDEDYESTNENMRDDDGDGIANNEDEDYENNPVLDGTNKSENAWNWQNENENAQWTMNKAERTIELKNKIGIKTSWTIDDIVWKFENSYKHLSIEEQKSRYEAFNEKINIVLEKIENLNLDDATEEKYKNIFEYLQLKVEEKSSEL